MTQPSAAARRPLAALIPILSVAIALPFLSATAATAAAAGRASDIEEITVSATRTAQPASAIPGTVTLIDRELVALRSNISDDLASVLAATVPGFAPSSQKLAGRGETLRGRNPLYLIDGIPQHNALRDGQRDGHTIDLAFVERIEVVNGSNAVQGVGATGGVVNIVTPRLEREAPLRLRTSARLTSADEYDDDALAWKGSVLASKGFERGAVMAGVAVHERGLFLDANGDPVGIYPTQGDIMDSTSVSMILKGEYDLTADRVVGFMLNDFDLERNGDYLPVPGDRALGIPSGTVDGDPGPVVGDPARNDVTTAALTWREDALLGGSLDAQLYAQRFRGLFEGGTFGGFFRLTPDGPPFLDQSRIESDKLGFRATWNRELAAVPLDLALGLDWFRDDSAQVLARSDREWVPETRFETVAPFAQLAWTPIEALTLSGGLRIEDARLEVDDYVTIAAANSTAVGGGEPAFTETLANVGLVWRFSDAWRLYGAFSEGFTMPDVGRVLRGVSSPGQSVDGLLDLEPVVTENRELGIEYDDGRLSGRVAYWESTADRGARLTSNAAGIFEVQREETEIDGIELTLSWALNETFTLAGNYARTNGRFDSDGDGAVDSDLDGLNVGPDRLNVYLDGVHDGGWRWRAQVSRLADRDFDGPAAPVGRDFDGFTLVELHVAKATRLGDFSLAVENLLDEDYFTYFAQTEPLGRSDTFFAGRGRTLSLGWRKDF